MTRGDRLRPHLLVALTLAAPLATSACTGIFGDPGGDSLLGGDAPGADGGAPGADGATRAVCNTGVHPAATDGRRITLAEYQHAVSDVFDGAVTSSAKFPGSYGKSVTGYSTETAINAVGEQDVAQIQLAAEEVAVNVAAALPTLLPCAATTADDACAGVFLDKYARRAFRRALTSDERAQLLATFHAALAAGDGATFRDAIALTVDHMLQTPQFLYVMEDAAPTARALNGDEIASRLSFLLWDSIPDDALLDAAASGALSDRKAILAQAQRMLASDKAATAVSRFFREWTGTIALAPANKDPATFPQFDAALAQSMNASFDRFVVAQVREQGTLTSLLRSPDVYVDGAMAAFYGVNPPPAGQWAKASLDPSRYTGISTQAALLASLAHPTDSSFVFRGKYVVTRLLCGALGDPPANASAVFGSLPEPPQPTGKDVAATIDSQPACAGCHTILNPPGLAFEHFDGIGKWRDTYASGKPIDTTGTLPDMGSGAVPFTAPPDLMDAIAHEPRFATCFTTQIFRFAMSRQDSPADQCALQALGDALQASGGKLADTLLALTTTDAFTYRIDP